MPSSPHCEDAKFGLAKRARVFGLPGFDATHSLLKVNRPGLDRVARRRQDSKDVKTRTKIHPFMAGINRQGRRIADDNGGGSNIAGNRRAGSDNSALSDLARPSEWCC